MTKPGFNPTATGGNMGFMNQRITNLDVTLELKLYPDAIITGTLTDAEGNTTGPSAGVVAAAAVAAGWVEVAADSRGADEPAR